MNKDEILSKSKMENRMQDEREKDIRFRGNVFGALGATVLCLILVLIRLSRGESVGDLVALMFSLAGCRFTYEGIKLKHGYTILLGVAQLVLMVYFLFEYWMGHF